MGTRSCHFEILGVAAPQGSKKFVGKSKETGRAILVEQSTRVKPWRATVVAFLRRAELGTPLRGPLGVNIEFYFPRPAGSSALYPSMGGVGDLDKLQRSTFDAFTTAGLWGDDKQVCEVHAKKLYAPFGAPPYMDARVWEMLDSSLLDRLY